MLKLVSISLVLASTVALAGCTTNTSAQVRPPSSPSASSMPSGAIGAARFDDGYVFIGDGPTIVDVYLDPLCPFCKRFEELSGPFLMEQAADKSATIRIHPVAVLDRLSSGTRYSTRAAASIVDVAANSPEALASYIMALYESQPAENTEGLTDDWLNTLAISIGAKPSCKEEQTQYQRWVGRITREAFSGTVDGPAGGRGLTHVPSVFVDGSLFPGNSDETASFQKFYFSAMTNR
jgi:protein-disulfide isomerase